MSAINGYQYQNIPSSEQQNDSVNNNIPDQHGGSYARIDPSPEVMQQQQQQQQYGPGQGEGNHNTQYQQQYTHASASASYRMPSYQDYIQNMNSYDTNETRTGFENYGFCNDNAGSGFMDWSYYRRQSKMNRLFLIIAVGIFILFLISHPTAQSNDSSMDAESKDDQTQKLKGVAGDEPSLPAAPSVETTSNNNNQATSHVASTKNSNNDHDASHDQNTSLQNLNISYLLAYPMSGSTFTMLLVSITTNTTLGTNYDYNAFKNDNGRPILIFSTSQDSPTDETGINGSPFWFESLASTNKPLKNVLTFSQCGGYCMYPCTPENYILTEATFDESCRTVIEQSQKQGFINASITPKSKVTKVVHLIRDPFSNVVSRFHAYLRDKAAKHELSMMYPNTMEGFRSWCNDMDNDAYLLRLEMEYPLISIEAKEWMRSIPCHSEFYKYISWHNHVVEMVWNEEYPYFQIYYEDFSTKDGEQEQAAKVAEFLEEPLVSNNYTLPEFLVVRMYSDFFTETERHNIEKFIRVLAYKKVMVMLERYFNVSAVGNEDEQ